MISFPRLRHLLAAVLCALPLASHAQKGPPYIAPGTIDVLPGAAETVIVPYDPKLPPAGQKPDRVYLPYERFLQLWQGTKDTRTAAALAARAVPDAPLPYALTSARYDARLAERALAVTGYLDLFTGAAWSKIPLRFDGATVSSLTLDGAPAALNGGDVLVEKPGRHALEVHFEIPRAPGANTLTWGIPATTATLLALTLPQSQSTASITPSSGVVEEVRDGARLVTAALGHTGSISITLRTAAGPNALATPASAKLRATVHLSTHEEETSADAEFAFPGATQNHFTLLLPKDATLTDLSAPQLQSWLLRPEGNQQALELTLYEPARETFTAHFSLRRTLATGPAGGPPPKYNAPVLNARAGQVEIEELALTTDGSLEVTPTAAPGLRRVEPKQPLAEGARLVAAYAGNGALSYTLAPRPARQEATIAYLYQVGRRQVDLFANLQLFAKGDPLLTTSINLPKGFEIETVQCDRPHDWWREGDRLQLRFRAAAPEVTSLVLYLVHREAAAPESLAIQPLQLEGFHKISGQAVLAAHKGVEVSLTLAGSAREMSATQASPEFSVIPPLERKRGFSFPDQSFSGQVKLQALPARTLATWATHAEAHESWLGLSTRVALAVRQGSIDHARFSLPASLPEARVTGEELREARSHVEGDRRLYDLDFQNDIYSEVEFTIELELPHTGEIALPAPAFPDAERNSGFLVIENGSEGEMRLQTTGLDPAQPADLPWVLTTPGATRLFRVTPGAWSATVTIERLEKTVGRLAFCAWADLSTALRHDGTEWHRAVWHLQNRALQFLPVQLPEGAELISVRVAGQSVRADRGSSPTKYGAPPILIPLIKTKPGELSYDVEAIFRLPAPADGKKPDLTHHLNDPELLGITVERTFWNLWLPAGYGAAKVDGNMEQIVGDISTADKLDDAVKELRELSTVARNSKVGSGTWQLATRNFELLCQSILSTNGDTRGSRDRDGKFNFRYGYGNTLVSKDAGNEVAAQADGPQPTPGPKNSKAREQNEYVANKRLEVVREVQRQKELFDATAKGVVPDSLQTLQPTRNNPPASSDRPAANNAPGGKGNVAIFGARQNGTYEQTAANAENNNSITLNAGASTNSSVNVVNAGTNFNSSGNPTNPNTRNLYITDNVILNQGNTTNPTAVNPAANLVIPGLEAVPGTPTTPAPAQAGQQSQPNAPASPSPGNNVQVFNNGDNNFNDSFLNTARGNRYVQQQQQQLQMQQQALTPEPRAEAKPGEKPAQPQAEGAPAAPAAAAGPAEPNLPFPGRPPTQVPGGVPAASTPQALAPPGSFNGALAGESAAAPAGGNPMNERSVAAPEGLITGNAFPANPHKGPGSTQNSAATALLADHRTTLNVDFPTEGEPLHFKKLKNAARLDVTLEPPAITHRVRNTGFLTLAALLLAFVQRRTTNRPRNRTSRVTI